MHLNQARSGLLWAQLRVPVKKQSIAVVQQALCLFAADWHFTKQQLGFMELAVEESFNIILQLIYGDIHLDCDWMTIGEFEINIQIKNNVLQVRITDNDLPYDFSMLPQFQPDALALGETDTRGLSVFLLQNIVDQVRVLPPSIHGQSLELEWQLPTENSVTATEGSKDLKTQWKRDDIKLRGFEAKDAIYVARLMHQNYGYTYVNPDLYIAEKICLRSDDGRLFSHIAVTPDHELVGHCAIMKASASDDILELGAAIVAPNYQGMGIFNRLWTSLEQLLPMRPEKAACVHAVSTHPYTQKIVLQHNYVVCALMLAYTPGSMQLKSMSHLKGTERGSVFYCCKLLVKPEPIKVFLPEPEVQCIQIVASQLGLTLLNQLDGNLQPSSKNAVLKTLIEYRVESSLNIAYLFVSNWNLSSFDDVYRILRHLCREGVDAVYALIDLSQADARMFYQDLIALGFIGAGLTPYMPYPATLMLQYINNQLLHEAAVFAEGAQAQQIKQRVFAAYAQREGL